MKTGADYARTYRNKQREKVERYEAALREIVCLDLTGHAAGIAREALDPPVLHIET